MVEGSFHIIRSLRVKRVGVTAEKRGDRAAAGRSPIYMFGKFVRQYIPAFSSTCLFTTFFE